MKIYKNIQKMIKTLEKDLNKNLAKQGKVFKEWGFYSDLGAIEKDLNKTIIELSRL